MDKASSPFCSPFDCGVDLACGNEKWLVTNDLLWPYVTGGECGDDKRTPFASLTQVICACPPAVDILPCGCSFSGGDGQNGKNLAITCFGYKAILDDAAMAEKLAKIPADLYPVDAMDLSDNSLTFVPLALPLYPLLAVLSLAKNKISAVKNTTTSGQLNLLSAPVLYLDLSSNAIVSIDDGLLPGILFGLQFKVDNQRFI